jgi:hypothetical protein
MKKAKFISIETTRYSEFFRRLLQEYGPTSHVTIDGKVFDETQFPRLIEEWCINDRIKRTKDFRLLRDKTALFGFHDSPSELWATHTELPFLERMAAEKLVRFRILKSRDDKSEQR